MARPKLYVLFDNNDMVLKLTGLRNSEALSGVFLNAAAVTIESIKDETGTNVTGATFPVTMTFIAGSNGNYRATLADNWGFILGQKHIAEVRADGGAGLRAEWALNIIDELRTE